MDESLKEYEKELVTLYTKSYDNYDTKLSYLSASSIGFSMVFIKDIVGNIDQCSLKWMLITSWLLLTLTLIFNLFSHTFTARKHNKTLFEIRGNNYDSTNAENRNTEIRYFNIFINILFSFGLGFLVLFIVINI